MSATMGLQGAGRICRNGAVIGVLVLATLLAACTGSTGSQGPTGPAGPAGPPGPPGSPGSGSSGGVSSATAITGTTTSAAVQADGTTVIKFQLVDQNGAPLKGLQASSISFAIANLTPGQNGAASYWTSYIYKTETPGACPSGVTACAAPPTPTTQATTEGGTSGALVDNGDGTYQYTFAKNITTDPIVKYDATLTHRVAFEIRGLAQANNAVYTWQPSTGATSGIFSREIVATATCDSCHGFLSAHGGARVDTGYCVICHSPQTADAYSGGSGTPLAPNGAPHGTVDFKVMIHKIHTGMNLPSIAGSPPSTTPTFGQGYWIIGHSNSVNNFNTVLFPQDTRNCTTCHAQNIASATEAANYYTVPTAEACGACHDNVNFATGLNHSTGIIADDSQCTTCHGPTANIDNGQLQVQYVHMIPEQVTAKKFQYNIDSVTFSVQAGSTYPVIKFSIVDPTNANKPYNILSDAPFVGVDPGASPPGTSVCASGAASLVINIAWDPGDYTNWGTGSTASAWGQPVSINPIVPGALMVPASCSSSTLVYGGASAPAIPAPSTLYGQAADGSFTVVAGALPAAPVANCPPTGPACAPVQSVAIVMQGHPGVVTTGPGAARIPVTSAVTYANAAGGAVVARRTIVDTAKCDVCHNFLSLHGSNRNDNTQVCVVCHNPASTDVSQRSAQAAPDSAGLWEQTIDFKHFIHAIHSATFRQTQTTFTPFVIYGFRGSVNDFTDVVFPQDVGNCYACHSVPDSGPTFYPGDPLMQAMTTVTGFSNDPSKPTPAGVPIATTPNMAACTGCHQDASTISHMEQNGGSTAVSKDAEGRMIPANNPSGDETCAVCHGAGAIADVGKVHNVIVPAN